MSRSEHDTPPEPDGLGTAATALIDKLRAFASTLEDDERRALAALLAPGIDAAWGDPAEVSGFSLDWEPELLPSYLADAIRDRDLRIEGL